ncbi:MAG: hypothetical protein ACOC54_02075, partial [Candidatus Sumerlaeota bacterium]
IQPDAPHGADYEHASLSKTPTNGLWAKPTLEPFSKVFRASFLNGQNLVAFILQKDFRDSP